MDLNNCVGRAGPLWERGNAGPKGSVFNLVNENARKSSGLISGIGLELGPTSMMNAEATVENKPAQKSDYS